MATHPAGERNQYWTHDHNPQVLQPSAYYSVVTGVSQGVGTWLLKEFDQVARAIGVKYFLHAGTLLGATRNGGWISWDDDVDIVLTRDQFARLERAKWSSGVALLASGRFHCTPRLILCESAIDGGDPMGIDIFIAENMPDSKPLRAGYEMLSMATTLLANSRSHAFDIRRKSVGTKALLWRMLRWIPVPQDASAHVARRMRSIIKTPGKQLRVFGHPRGLPHKFDAAWFGAERPIQFGDAKYPAPIGTGEVLTTLYGLDYIIPPPVGQRQPHPSLSICVNFGRGVECWQRAAG